MTSRRRLAFLLLALLAALPAAGGGAGATPETVPAIASPLGNLGFEQGEPGQPPPGWFVPAAIAAAGYSAATVSDRPEGGARCALLSSGGASGGTTPAGPQIFGNLMGSFSATPFRGKRVRFSAAVRAEVAAGNQARLWLRVDRPEGERGFFDNMEDRPITAAGWQRYEIVGDVAPDAEVVNLGLLLVQEGRAWIDSARFEVIGALGDGDEAPRPLTRRGLANLVAFTRLLGYVRFFHPSDQAAAADWTRLALAGVQAVEGAAGPERLAQALEGVFGPVAPTVRVFRTGRPPPGTAPPAPPAGAKILGWRHHGVGLGAPNSIYESQRVESAPAAPFAVDLGGGVSALVPLTLPADAGGTLPRVEAGIHPAAPAKPDGFVPSGRDRATRLADVALAWNVFQHFYPYFDLPPGPTGADWQVVLPIALRAAATDAGERAFAHTLSRLVAALDDGHGGVYHGSLPRGYSLPLNWDWIAGQLVVTVAQGDSGQLAAGDSGQSAGGDSGQPAAAVPPPGSVVLTIGRRSAAAALVEQEREVSAATPQWRRYRALRALAAGGKGEELQLRVRRPDGQEADVTLRREIAVGLDGVPEPRPEKIAELRPGILYVDLSRIDDDDFQGALGRLAAARGVIFDLRGYPARISPVVLAHLTDRTLTSARWNVPVVTRPDRQGTTFELSDWPVEPAAPRIAGRVAFLTDGRAISYAETLLGIVESYHLAEIVGGATAGTNGNVNPFTLPGGYAISWTGMKVEKHNGSRHHGVGILPTVPVARTLRGVTEGRDEVLEKGIEVVSGAAERPAAKSGATGQSAKIAAPCGRES